MGSLHEGGEPCPTELTATRGLAIQFRTATIELAKAATKPSWQQAVMHTTQEASRCGAVAPGVVGNERAVVILSNGVGGVGQDASRTVFARSTSFVA